ncbi:MAG: hypothetical protein ACK45I_12395 [Bacteroidota bacterium]
MKLKFVFIMAVLCWSVEATAQLSFEPKQFIIDLEDWLDKSGSKRAKDAVADFSANYNSGKWNAAQKLQVIKLSTDLLNARVAYAVWEDYLNAMNGLANANQLGKFDAWHKAARLAFDKSKDEFSEYVRFSSSVFFDNILAKQGAATWYIDNMDMDMDLRGTPSILFKKTNIFCYTQGDTITIMRTSGRYIPSEKIWKGTSGTYTWARLAKDSAEISAELKSYTIQFETGQLKADTALLSYPLLFSQPIAGTITDKPFAQSMGEKSVYPKFESHQRNFKNLPFGRGLLTGGFALTGKVVRGIGSSEHKAELWFSYKDKPMLKLMSDEFVVRGDRVQTKTAEMVLYLDKDSVYHPQIEFAYFLNDSFIRIFRSNQGISQAPFTDYYHGYEIYVDELRWKLTEPVVEADMQNDEEPARFESYNYFREFRYERIQGILDYNPLERIKSYVQKQNVKGYYISDYAKNYKSNISDIRLQVIQLHDKGYVTYYPKKDYVHVNRKLYDAVNSHYGKTDYDVLAFFSIIKRYPNATISLINNDLQIQGVPKFSFSDSQNVYVIPKDQLITMRKNRAMDFSGKIRSGKAEFYGTGFIFDYGQFQVRLNNIDSMNFFYFDPQEGRDMRIKSSLQDVYGTLSIDHPANKSGRKKIPGYPVFKSDKGSNVYYDKPETHNSVYDRKRFFFKVDPFTLDSLNELNFRTLTLPGELNAANIVPNFRNEIYLQPDQSLGFVRQVTEEGYTMYGGKGKGKMILNLSDQGFYGNGQLNYVASITQSDKFLLMPDSMNTTAQTFLNERTTTFPNIEGKNVYEHWIPYSDTMLVTPVEGTLSLSEGRALLLGTAIITPKRIGARGSIKVEEAEMTSNDFWLRPDNVQADSSTFKVKQYDNPNLLAFHTEQVKGDIDLTARKGSFEFHHRRVNSIFDYNQYVGSFQSFEWDINKRMLDFAPYQINGKDASYLLSVRKLQDSLSFVTGRTIFDLNDFAVTALKVPFIRVADAFILPDSGKVTVLKEAEMKMLTNAQIIADTLYKFHKMERCNITIFGKFNIQADGYYEYKDKQIKSQFFFLNIIKIDEVTKRLLGKTTIPDTPEFYVGKKIRFKGIATVLSISKNLEYEGFFLTEHTLPRPKSDWFRNKAIINRDSVHMHVDGQQTNERRQAMMAGMAISNDSSHVYPLFFTRKRNASDAELMRMEGTLRFDEPTSTFSFGSKDRVFKTGLKGNIMELREPKQQVYTEGVFNIGFNTSKAFETYAAGSAVYNLKDTSFVMDVMLMLDYPFPSSATRLLFDTINLQSAYAPSTKLDIPMLKSALTQYIKEERSLRRVMEELDDNSIRLVNDIVKQLFFSHIRLRWDPVSRSLISVGELSLNSIDKYKLEKKLKGRLQISKKRTGDELMLYLELNDGGWYYFKLLRGVWYVLGSDPVFNKTVKENMDKVSKKDDKYDLRLANIGERNKLVRLMKLENKK